ncbi:hypothetical protein [Daejeonella sp. JGW-45]|uniref:hypothetical protein n=1 Tax=Daejeonella sp. JGW-45 TaxID=3034148 RepID=UPI0023EB007E|nr:hypothetical protein [Daejeonella sp. JGW-45]
MVTVTNYVQKTSQAGKIFFALELTGEVEMSISQTTGRMFATARKCMIPSSLDENTCKSLIGKQMPGCIQKVDVDEPYEYTIPRTGETVLLDYRYEYSNVEMNQTLEAAILG